MDLAMCKFAGDLSGGDEACCSALLAMGCRLRERTTCYPLITNPSKELDVTYDIGVQVGPDGSCKQ